MVLQKLWVSQNLVEFYGSRSLIFLAVMCISQSHFYTKVSRSPDSFVCFLDLMSPTRVYNKRLICKTFVLAHSSSLS